MQVRELMTENVIHILPEEPVEVAARALARYNIGALPVCGGDGKLRGMVTDRDLTVRCLALGAAARNLRVQDVMTTQLATVQPETELEDAVALMGEKQLRRLPVTREGRVCGILSLADLAAGPRTGNQAAAALESISRGLSSR
ncbi:MAG: CBS domain-containing protein [Faecousia sp.]